MRRWMWLLGLLVVGIAGTAWWSSRNAIRLEPLDAQRFAQMQVIRILHLLVKSFPAAAGTYTNRAAKVHKNEYAR